jgi:hypothetical protein
MPLRDILLANTTTAVAFLSFYVALAFVPGSVATGIEFSLAPSATWALSRFPKCTMSAEAVVFMLLSGCGLAFASSRANGTMSTANWFVGVSLSVLAACGAASVAEHSRRLARRGIPATEILATRFHLTYLLALVAATICGLPASHEPVPANLAAVGLLGIVLPLHLLQHGLARVPSVVVMVIMAAVPSATYLIELAIGAARAAPVSLGLAVSISILVVVAGRIGPAAP